MTMTLLHAVDWNLVTLVVGFIGGYWVKGQTVASIEADVSAIKNYIIPSTPVAVVAQVTPTPVV